MLSKHRGEFLLAFGAVFFSAGGIFVTVILKYMPAFHLAQFRSISAVLILGTYLALTRPELLKAKRAELKRFVVYGVVGFALVNFGYLLGIERGVPLALVLILEFTAAIWIALWIKFVRRGYVAKRCGLQSFSHSLDSSWSLKSGTALNSTSSALQHLCSAHLLSLLTS